MNRIEIGKEYRACRAFSGNNIQGPWELVVVEDKNSHFPVAIFVNDAPKGIMQYDTIRVNNILNVTYGSKQDSAGNWRDNISILADIERVDSPADLNPQIVDWEPAVPGSAAKSSGDTLDKPPF